MFTPHWLKYTENNIEIPNSYRIPGDLCKAKNIMIALLYLVVYQEYEQYALWLITNILISQCNNNNNI